MVKESHPERQPDDNAGWEGGKHPEDLDNGSDHSGSSSLPDVHSSTTGEDAPKLARRETTAVWSFRVLAMLVLLLSTVAVAIATYTFTRNAERELFEDTFHDDALKILESLGSSLDKAIAGVDAYVISMVSE